MQAFVIKVSSLLLLFACVCSCWHQPELCNCDAIHELSPDCSEHCSMQQQLANYETAAGADRLLQLLAREEAAEAKRASFVRMGKKKRASFVRMGKRASFVRMGKKKRASFVRMGKRASFVRMGKKKRASFVRMGKRASFVRMGKKKRDLQQEETVDDNGIDDANAAS